MSPALLLLVRLVLAIGDYVILRRYQRAGRGRLGLAGGDLVYADDSLARRPTLRSERLGLQAWPSSVAPLERG